MMSLLRVLLVAFLYFAAGSALRCYNCTHNSVAVLSETGCEGPNIDSRHLITCSSGLTKCSKSQASITVGTTTVTAIIRGCINALSDSCQTIGLATVCTCSTDGCNSSSNITTSFALMFTFVFLGQLLVSR